MVKDSMINPKLEFCSCGYCFEPTLFMKIIILVKGSYVKRCPKCQCNLVLQMSSFVYVNERKHNLDKNIWRRG